MTQQQQPLFYCHYTGQPALAGTSSWELEDFVGAKFYCPHALADGNQRIRIMDKTLEFSSTVLSLHCLHCAAIKHLQEDTRDKSACNVGPNSKKSISL